MVKPSLMGDTASSTIMTTDTNCCVHIQTTDTCLVCIVVSCLVCIVIVILFLELQGMLLMKNCISRRLDVISLGLLYIGVNCASFVWTSGHICVDKWSYLFGEVVIFGSQDVRKCGNISLWGRWTKL